MHWRVLLRLARVAVVVALHMVEDNLAWTVTLAATLAEKQAVMAAAALVVRASLL